MRQNASFVWAALLCLAVCQAPAVAQLSSYAVSATDVQGATGAPAVALGVPDYCFVNDAGLGFGGTSTDVFGAGESVELTYSTPLLNSPLQHDVVLSAFVGGLGATDTANIQVDVSSDGVSFSTVQTFNTHEARNRPQDFWENDFEGVKHFFVEFGAANNVTHIRLTNLMCTSEGFRLDAVEGLHPVVNGAHAFEVRLERVREETARRFKVRIKNIGGPTGVAIREWRMDRTASLARLEDTAWMLESADGDFICVDNCILDNHPTFIPFSRHVWSIDGMTEAPAGLGLDPGRQAAHARYADFDTDGGLAYLSGFVFSVTFTDGFVHTFDYDLDVTKEIGSLYQKYLYFSSTPAQSWNRPVDYYEFVLPGGLAIGTPECSPAVANSTGAGATLRGEGSELVADNDVLLIAEHLPTNSAGYFLASTNTGFVAAAGGSSGNLCLGGSIGRYAGNVLNAGTGGIFELQINVGNIAQPTGGVGAMAGQTWRFQAWYRDFNGSATSNFTHALAITFG